MATHQHMRSLAMGFIQEIPAQERDNVSFLGHDYVAMRQGTNDSDRSQDFHYHRIFYQKPIKCEIRFNTATERSTQPLAAMGRALTLLPNAPPLAQFPEGVQVFYQNDWGHPGNEWAHVAPAKFKPIRERLLVFLPPECQVPPEEGWTFNVQHSLGRFEVRTRQQHQRYRRVLQSQSRVNGY